MKGPFPVGTWNADFPISEWSWERDHMIRGHAYRVIKSFTDAHDDIHSVGEEWIFIRSMFSKFDDELTLCTRSSNGEEWTMSLIWKPGRQQEIIENFLGYVEPIRE